MFKKTNGMESNLRNVMGMTNEKEQVKWNNFKPTNGDIFTDSSDDAFMVLHFARNAKFENTIVVFVKIDTQEVLFMQSKDFNQANFKYVANVSEVISMLDSQSKHSL